MLGVLNALLAVLLQFALGMLFAALLTDWRREVTRGFLFVTAATALVVALLALGLGGLARVDGPERLAQGSLMLGLFGYVVSLAHQRRAPRLLVGSATLAVGLVALGMAAAARPGPMVGETLTALAFYASALALGTASAGLLLGHWYLVTPRLPSRPLRLLCDLLLISLVPLAALATWYLWLETGSSGDQTAFPGLSGGLLWVGAGMITLFPFGVTVAARLCCVDGPGRGRSLQAATGLLYLAAAAVLAGGLAGNAVLLGA
jgi:hypothetical protein